MVRDPFYSFEPYLTAVLLIVSVLVFFITLAKAQPLTKGLMCLGLGVAGFIAYYFHPDFSIYTFRLMFVMVAAFGYFVSITQKARNSADAEGISERDLLNTAKGREQAGRDAGGFWRKPGTNIVGKFQENSDGSGARMIDIARDSRFDAEGNRIGSGVSTPAKTSSSVFDNKRAERERKKLEKAAKDRARTAATKTPTQAKPVDPRAFKIWPGGGKRRKNNADQFDKRKKK